MQTSTYFALLSEFQTAEIPLDLICDKFFGLSPAKAKRRAALASLPVPAYRAGSQKSQWLVSAEALAEYLDRCKSIAYVEWQKIDKANAGRAFPASGGHTA